MTTTRLLYSRDLLATFTEITVGMSKGLPPPRRAAHAAGVLLVYAGYAAQAAHKALVARGDRLGKWAHAGDTAQP